MSSKKAVEYIELEKYGEEGVMALASETPIETGRTANSWYYTIEKDQNGKTFLNFMNNNFNQGINIAVLIQIGHATRDGKWLAGEDYINPAIQPIFDKIAREKWGEITRL